MQNLINELKKTVLVDSQNQIMIGNNFIKIKENNSKAKLKAVTINNFDNNDVFFGFTLDLIKYNRLTNYVNRENYNKGCDGIIVLIRNTQVYVLICELKSTRPKPKQFVNQIKSSEAFLYYILEAIKIFNDSKISKEQIKIIRLLFDTKNISKGLTNLQNSNPETINENIYEFDCFEGDKTAFHINKILDLLN